MPGIFNSIESDQERLNEDRNVTFEQWWLMLAQRKMLRRVFKGEDLDHMRYFGYPQRLVFNCYGLQVFHLVLVAFDLGLLILAAAFHGAHATVCHHFHGAGGSFMQDSDALYPAHAQVPVNGKAGR